ncbi:DUF6949 family protein [Chthonobacter albigriseus]|uniref:DUF6949 family protein n=1 Tax=Chthonobacter albigriseus TaxID=1683161 RepID=UPI0015EF4814|nr:hypothetical protein [Chthonobacter albigriseus]
MLRELIITFFAIATGFVGAGILSSLYQLVTTRPARFDMEGETVLKGIAAIMLLMFAGPVILMRNAIRARLEERRPFGWLAASTVIAGCWSLCSGFVLLEFVLALRDSL